MGPEARADAYTLTRDAVRALTMGLDRLMRALEAGTVDESDIAYAADAAGYAVRWLELAAAGREVEDGE